MASSLSSLAWCRNANISETRKDIPGRRMPFFFDLKGFSNKRQLFFTS